MRFKLVALSLVFVGVFGVLDQASAQDVGWKINEKIEICYAPNGATEVTLLGTVVANDGKSVTLTEVQEVKKSFQRVPLLSSLPIWGKSLFTNVVSEDTRIVGTATIRRVP